MTDRPVIFFMFAGRRGNLEVNIPQVLDILDRHPNVEFHLWNLGRIESDRQYVERIRHERITHCSLYSGRAAYRHMNRVWQHYTHPRFKDSLFVKVDDDVVFLETGRFGNFLDAVEVNPQFVVSANVVNNGACTPITTGLWNGFTDLNIPLLDVHESNAYAEMAHEYFLENWADMLEQPVDVIQTEDWLSINLVGMHWPMLCKVWEAIGARSPREIAGRLWEPGSRVGDEGAVNMLPRALMRGFTVAHLGFGPQSITEEQEEDWRGRYAALARKYLGGWVTADGRKPEGAFG